MSSTNQSNQHTDLVTSDINHSKNQSTPSRSTCTSPADHGLFTAVEASTLLQDLFPKKTSSIHNYYICPRKGCSSLSQTETERNGKNKFSHVCISSGCAMWKGKECFVFYAKTSEHPEQVRKICSRARSLILV